MRRYPDGAVSSLAVTLCISSVLCAALFGWLPLFWVPVTTFAAFVSILLIILALMTGRHRDRVGSVIALAGWLIVGTWFATTAAPAYVRVWREIIAYWVG